MACGCGKKKGRGSSDSPLRVSLQSCTNCGDFVVIAAKQNITLELNGREKQIRSGSRALLPKYQADKLVDDGFPIWILPTKR